MLSSTPLFLLALLTFATPTACAAIPAQEADADQEKAEESHLSSGTLSGLKFRSIGPAMTGGRVTDFAVVPGHRNRYYAALAAGGIWKTENAGTTWKPVFDGQSSYSIGCLALDPSNPHTIWAGSGENNSQRSVSFGDGVYRSRDGGQSWENMGLKESEHIGMIVVDPRDSNTVFVAAQGPLWRSGGERGLYKTTDGGATWVNMLEVDEHTGVNEVHIDPRNPDVMYASTYQRARRVWTLINGGPGSGIHKSEDGGETWREVKSGLPSVDMGRIGMDVSPANPDVIYAIVEAAQGKGGVFRSVNRGETWSKASGYMASSPQYYNELVCDPHDADKVYSLDTFLNVSSDGGKSFSRVKNTNRHVDDHALWLDPNDPDYLLVGCDGGIYDSFDGGQSWAFHANMPVAQFYRVSVDDSKPFYHVYGGTQDNNSMGGPSRTTSPGGMANEDWYVTVGGDGYEALAEPGNPDIVYTMWQYGGLVRYDRRSKENVDIRPRERLGDDPYRWNWDSPLIVSPHQSTRLYFAAQRLFRSDDRGNSWVPVSEDLSRQLDRNQMEIMGRVWGVDAVSKNRSTSFYGNIVALTESPKVEGLLYVGTDDGLIQVSEDGGKNWRKVEGLPGVDELAYVSRLEASLHDADTVYAAFSNHKMGDFKPYLYRSSDRGRTWQSIAGDLPEREIVWSLAQDHVKPELMFAGTEFGVYCTLNGGENWLQMKGGLPTIAVRDVAIHKGEDDLVLGTFGRSFYVLDDYSALRDMSEEQLAAAPQLFPVADALLFNQTSRLGGREGRGSQGAAYYTAENQPFGAIISYYLPEKLNTIAEARRKAEKELRKDGGDVPYPDWDELRAEDEENAPQVMLVIRDDKGNLVQRVPASRSKGLHRAVWNLREPSSNPLPLTAPKELAPWESPQRGVMALPGTYSVALAQLVEGQYKELTTAQSFDVMPLGLSALPEADRADAYAFQSKVARLNRAMRGSLSALGDLEKRLGYLRKSIIATPDAPTTWIGNLDLLQKRTRNLRTVLSGDRTVSSRQEPTYPSLSSRVSNIVGNQWSTMMAPTQMERDAYEFAAGIFQPMLADLQQMYRVDLPALEKMLDAAGASWTPGRVPDWKKE